MVSSLFLVLQRPHYGRDTHTHTLLFVLSLLKIFNLMIIIIIIIVIIIIINDIIIIIIINDIIIMIIIMQ